MRIRRGLLFWGLFLIPLGVLPLLVRANVLAPEQVADAWRFWPVLLIALGVAVILGRSRAGLLGTAIAAIALGLVGGGALASGVGWVGNVGDCGNLTRSDTDDVVDQAGGFGGPASATFEMNCGSVAVSVAPGSGWTINARYRGDPPTIEASTSSLAVRAPGGFGLRRQDWTVVLPADQTRTVEVKTNAGTGTLTLAGATLTRLRAELNAGEVRIDGTGATVERLDASVNAGSMKVTLGGATGGDLSVNAGSIELCVPPDAALRLQVQDQLTFGHNLRQRGLAQSDETWTRQGSGPQIDLSVDGNAASFTLDPDGGCK
jgi:hypothetical protein